MPSNADRAERAKADDATNTIDGVVGTIKAPAGRTAEPLVSFESSSLDELQQQLRSLLERHINNTVPTFVTGTFAISADAVIRINRPVAEAEDENGTPQTSTQAEATPNATVLDPSLRTGPDGKPTAAAAASTANAAASTPVHRGRRGKTVHDDVVARRVLTDVDPPAERTKSQRGIAKAIVAAVGQIDGFAYGVRNEWESKKDGHRFQYACQDSLQNKDRKRNTLRIRKVAKDPDSPAVASSSMLPTYDCGGLLTIKFSTARAKIDVLYGHAAIHRTVAARREPKGKGEKSGSKPSTPTAPVHAPQVSEPPPATQTPTPTPYYLPKPTPSEPPMAMVPTPLDYPPPPPGHPMLVHPQFDPATPHFGDAPPFIPQPYMSLDPHHPNPYFTTNGAAVQDGVFEHRPNIVEPWKPIPNPPAAPPVAAVGPATPNTIKDKPTTSEKRKRATGIVRSRKGCTTCRQRRIKCDEGHPICINCSKSRRECSYASPDVSSAMSSPGTTHSLPSAGPEAIASNPGPGDGHNWQPLPTANAGPVPSPFAAQDLSASMRSMS